MSARFNILLNDSPERTRLVRWLLALALWTGFALISATQTNFAILDEGRSQPWRLFLPYQLAFWYLWGLFAPLILWISRRYTVENWLSLRAVALYIGAGIIMVLAHSGLFIFITGLLSLVLSRPSSHTMPLMTGGGRKNASVTSDARPHILSNHFWTMV